MSGMIGMLLVAGSATTVSSPAVAANETAEQPSSVVSYHALTLTVPRWGGGAVPVPAWSCPEDHPYLWRYPVMPGAMVPRGVSFAGKGEVKIPNVAHAADGRVAGWLAGGVAGGTDFLYSGDVTVTAHCTNDVDEAYFTTPPAAPDLPTRAQAYFLNEARSYTVRASGFPAPALRIVSGSLPQGLTFTDNGDGTATIAGRPFGTENSRSILIEAKNVYGMRLQTLNIYW